MMKLIAKMLVGGLLTGAAVLTAVPAASAAESALSADAHAMAYRL